MARAARDFERDKTYGVEGELLDARRSPARAQLSGDFAGAVHWSTPGFVPDPGGLAKAYAALFRRKGGRFMVGDARTLNSPAGDGRHDHRPVTAREVVVALGPWSDLVFGRWAIPFR